MGAAWSAQPAATGGTASTASASSSSACPVLNPPGPSTSTPTAGGKGGPVAYDVYGRRLDAAPPPGTGCPEVDAALAAGAVDARNNVRGEERKRERGMGRRRGWSATSERSRQGRERAGSPAPRPPLLTPLTPPPLSSLFRCPWNQTRSPAPASAAPCPPGASRRTSQKPASGRAGRGCTPPLRCFSMPWPARGRGRACGRRTWSRSSTPTTVRFLLLGGRWGKGGGEGARGEREREGAALGPRPLPFSLSLPPFSHPRLACPPLAPLPFSHERGHLAARPGLGGPP